MKVESIDTLALSLRRFIYLVGFYCKHTHARTHAHTHAHTHTGLPRCCRWWGVLPQLKTDRLVSPGAVSIWQRHWTALWECSLPNLWVWCEEHELGEFCAATPALGGILIVHSLLSSLPLFPSLPPPSPSFTPSLSLPSSQSSPPPSRHVYQCTTLTHQLEHQSRMQHTLLKWETQLP